MNKLLIIILILSSCQSYRAERKIKKLKEWGYLSSDTITKYDTIKGFTHDTLVQFDTLHHTDTLFTNQNGLKVTTIVKWKERQVKQTITQRDTILEHKYTTKVLKEKRKWWEKYTEPFFYFILVCFLVFVFDLIKTAFKK